MASTASTIDTMGSTFPPPQRAQATYRPLHRRLSTARLCQEAKPSCLCPYSHVDAPHSRVLRRNVLSSLFTTAIFPQLGSIAELLNEFKEYIDIFDGYSLLYPKNWIQVRGAGADIFFRDPFVLDENVSVELSSPSSSRYKTVEDLGPPQAAAEKVLKQYFTEFMSTRLGVRRESSILSTSSRIADDGKVYYQDEVNIKSYANNNELDVMPQDRIARLEWDRRYL